METINKSYEMDYYSEIIAIYNESNNCDEMKYLAKNWTIRSYISLIDDMKNNKSLEDANIDDVVRNSMILMLNMFNEKTPDKKISDIEFNEQEKKMIKKDLIKYLE